MSAFVKDIKNVWSVCGRTAEECVKVVKRELGEYGKGWAEAEEFWKEHPEAMMDCFQI